MDSIDFGPIVDAFTSGDHATLAVLVVIALATVAARYFSGKWPVLTRVAEFLKRVKVAPKPAALPQDPVPAVVEAPESEKGGLGSVKVE